MQTQTTKTIDQNLKPKSQLRLVKLESHLQSAKKLWLASIIKFFTKVFKTSDLTYESWQRLESHKYSRSYERDSYMLRLHV